jgi:hypothetical protein
MHTHKGFPTGNRNKDKPRQRTQRNSAGVGNFSLVNTTEEVYPIKEIIVKGLVFHSSGLMGTEYNEI